MGLDFLNDPRLRKFVREFSTGEYLFEETYLGDALFLIVDGMVGVYKKTGTGKRLLYGATNGDVVGEKAIISDPGFKRECSAQAECTVTTLEFDRRSFLKAQSFIPDIAMKMLKTVELRVDQANELISILYSTNEIDRITEFINYYFKYNRRFGKNLVITLDDITVATNTDPVLTQRALEELSKKGILKPVGNAYSLSDSVALTQYSPELRERLAA